MEKSWRREERKAKSGVYVISPLRHRSFIFQVRPVSTMMCQSDRGRAGGQRVDTGGPQRGGPTAADIIHDTFQVSVRNHFRLELQTQCPKDIHGSNLDPQLGNVALHFNTSHILQGLATGASTLWQPAGRSAPKNLSLMKRRSYFMAEIMTRCRSRWVGSCRRCSIGLAQARSGRLVCRFHLAERQPERRCDRGP